MALASTVALGLSLPLGPHPALAAGPTIKASVRGNAGTLTVTGSNLPKSAHLAVEFSGDAMDPTNYRVDGQYYPVNSDKHGSIHGNFKVFVNSSCLVMVQVVFAHTPTDVAPPIVANTAGRGCTPATITTGCDPAGCADPSNILVQGKNWTPGTPVNLQFSQASTGNYLDSTSTTSCGASQPGVLIRAPAGVLTSSSEGGLPALPPTPCTGDEDYSVEFCALGPIVVRAWVTEEEYFAPPVTFPGC